MVQSNGIANPQTTEKNATGKRKRGEGIERVDKKSQSVEEVDRSPAHQVHSLQDFLVDILEILQRQAKFTIPQ